MKRTKYKLKPLTKNDHKMLVLDQDEVNLDSFGKESVMTEYRNKTTTGDVTEHNTTVQSEFKLDQWQSTKTPFSIGISQRDESSLATTPFIKKPVTVASSI